MFLSTRLTFDFVFSKMLYDEEKRIFKQAATIKTWIMNKDEKLWNENWRL